MLERLGYAMRQFLPSSDGLSDTFIRQLRAIGLTVAGGFGSITILIQHEQPADTANWLPAPAAGPFNLTMRMYGAQTPVLEGTYRLPPVTKTR